MYHLIKSNLGQDEVNLLSYVADKMMFEIVEDLEIIVVKGSEGSKLNAWKYVYQLIKDNLTKIKINK